MFFWLFLCLFQTLPSNAQNLDTSFYRHLETHQLSREQNVWWQSNNIGKHDLPDSYARFLLQAASLTPFLALMQAFPDLKQDSCLTEKASQQFILADDSIRQYWFTSLQRSSYNGQTAQLYRLAEQQNTLWSPTFDSRIYPAFQHMRRAQQKNLAVAVGFDLVIPGAGKAYLGMPRHGLQTAFLMALLGWASAESIQKYGWTSAWSIVNVSALGTVYLSNIFGTAYHHKTRKASFKRNYYHEVQKYTSLYSCF